MAPAPDYFATAQAESDRALRRNLKGLEYLAAAGPTLGATPKDVLVDRGTMRRLYHHQPRAAEVYRIPSSSSSWRPPTAATSWTPIAGRWTSCRSRGSIFAGRSRT